MALDMVLACSIFHVFPIVSKLMLQSESHLSYYKCNPVSAAAAAMFFMAADSVDSWGVVRLFWLTVLSGAVCRFVVVSLKVASARHACVLPGLYACQLCQCHGAPCLCF